MKVVLTHEVQGRRTFVLAFTTGDEVMATLTTFASERGITAGHFTAIGAFSGVVVAFFDWRTKTYTPIRFDEQVEVLSLAGDVSVEDRKPKIHAHVVIGKADATAHGGHLLEGWVRPTLETVLTELPSQLERRFDAESGLALITSTGR
jgi:predicted DNA-binding protein with PD1-like motif